MLILCFCPKQAHNTYSVEKGFIGAWAGIEDGGINLRTLVLWQNLKIHLTENDFNEMTDYGALCCTDGTIGVKEFDSIMRRQLKRYVLPT
jgi:hypothetical protein